MELRGYHAKESKEDGAETTEFYIRWVSSRTLREHRLAGWPFSDKFPRMRRRRVRPRFSMNSKSPSPDPTCQDSTVCGNQL